MYHHHSTSFISFLITGISCCCSRLEGLGTLQSHHKDAIVVSMGGNPSGRSQTLLLATWLSGLLQHCSTAAQPDSPVTNVELSQQSGSLGRGQVEQATSTIHAADVGVSRRSKAAPSPQHSPRHLKLGSELPAALWQGLPGTALGHALALILRWLPSGRASQSKPPWSCNEFNYMPS